MTEMELDNICSKEKDCDCMNCELFARYMNTDKN